MNERQLVPGARHERRAALKGHGRVSLRLPGNPEDGGTAHAVRTPVQDPCWRPRGSCPMVALVHHVGQSKGSLV